MQQTWVRAALFAAFGAVVLVAAGPATADDKKMTVKEIMAAGHKGADANMAKVTLAVKGGKWEDAQKYAKAMAGNGAKLADAKPARGDAKSWETLAKKYAENTKALADAADKKDADATKAAVETLSASCKACHDAHRGKGK